MGIQYKISTLINEDIENIAHNATNEFLLFFNIFHLPPYIIPKSFALIGIIKLSPFYLNSITHYSNCQVFMN